MTISSKGDEEDSDSNSNSSSNSNDGDVGPSEVVDDDAEAGHRRRGIVDRTNGRVKDERTSNDNKLPLPTPDFTSAPTLKTSVFSNPFVEAEKAKSAILEKHVKMTPTLDDTKMINGRKICWNYRKGRCRFGHNCTFAHDSDLHRSAAELEALRTPEETVICQTTTTTTTTTTTANDEEQEIDQENNQLQKRKKRPGLAQNLVPGKKVLKLYKAQQAKAVSR